MKPSILFLLFISFAGTPVYNHALSWDKDDLTKMGIAATGVAALFYFFSNSSDAQETLTHQNSHEFDKFDYSDGEHNSLSSDFFVQQEQPAQTNSGLVSSVPTFLCLGVLGYFGYNYFQDQEDGAVNATNQKPVDTQPEKVKKKESVFNPERFEPKTIAEVNTEIGTLDYIKSQMTVINFGWAAGLLVAFYSLRFLATQWENPGAKQASLYADIAYRAKRSAEVQQRLCNTISIYEREKILNQREALAINSHVAWMHDELCKYQSSSELIARSFGGYKNELTTADMVNLTYYENRTNELIAEIESIERKCRSRLFAEVFSKKLIEKFAVEQVELDGGFADQFDCPTKAVSIESNEIESTSIINEKSDLKEAQDSLGKKKPKITSFVENEQVVAKTQDSPEIGVEKESKNFEEASVIAHREIELENEKKKQAVVDTEKKASAVYNKQDVSDETQGASKAEIKKLPEHPREWFKRAGEKIKAEKRIRDKVWAGLRKGPEMIAATWHWSWCFITGQYE